MRERARTAVALGAGLCALLACGFGPAQGAPPAPDRVQARGSEYDLILSKRKVAPGRVIVQFLNAGEDAHDLRLQRLRAGAQVGSELGVGEIGPGDYANLDTRLRKGSRYLLWCSLSDHRRRGMEATLRVRRHRR